MSDTEWRRDGAGFLTSPPRPASGGQEDSGAAPEAVEDTQTRGQSRDSSRTERGLGPGSNAQRFSE